MIDHCCMGVWDNRNSSRTNWSFRRTTTKSWYWDRMCSRENSWETQTTILQTEYTQKRNPRPCVIKRLPIQLELSDGTWEELMLGPGSKMYQWIRENTVITSSMTSYVFTSEQTTLLWQYPMSLTWLIETWGQEGDPKVLLFNKCSFSTECRSFLLFFFT